MDSGQQQFFLIDQSLKGVGGHHFDYSVQVANAAIAAGAKVTIGANQKFKAADAFASCHVESCFRNTTYAASSQMVGIQEMVGRRKQGLLRKMLRVFRVGKANGIEIEQDRQRRITSFRDDCEIFFKRELQASDIIFFTTLSDLESEGLAEFISQRPDAKNANWHIQFHFPLFLGRTPEYKHQEILLELIKPVFEKLATISETANISCYVTSDTLRNQYLKLGFEFESLPYPIDSQFLLRDGPKLNDGPKPNDDWFRITFAGASRKEKGEGAVKQIANKLPEDFIAQNKIKIVTQKKKPHLLKRFRSILFNAFRTQARPKHSHLIETVQFPLSDQQYREFILTADIGLLTTYDSRTYFSRRAGILGEYLTAGVPVIVPAGCWLSDQIEVSQQKYLGSLFADANQRLDVDFHNESTTDGVNVKLELPTSQCKNRVLILQLEIRKPAQHGTYASVKKLDAEQRYNVEQSNDRQSSDNFGDELQIIGLSAPSDSHQHKWVAFQIDSSESMLKFEIADAYPIDTNQDLKIANVTAALIESNEIIPRSLIGLVAAKPEFAPGLIREMVAQYSHYSVSAAQHAKSWFAMHDPNLTFATLIENSANVIKSIKNLKSTQIKNKQTAA